MIFTVIREGEEHLEHADRKNHKYIEKHKSKSGKWVYVYANKDVHLQIDKHYVDGEMALNDARQYERSAELMTQFGKNNGGTATSETKKTLSMLEDAARQRRNEYRKESDISNSIADHHSVKNTAKRTAKAVKAKTTKAAKSVSEKAASAKSKIQNTINNLNKKKKKKTNNLSSGRQKNLSGKTATVGRKGNKLGTGKVGR